MPELNHRPEARRAYFALLPGDADVLQHWFDAPALGGCLFGGKAASWYDEYVSMANS
jgi:hypothetical protein